MPTVFVGASALGSACQQRNLPSCSVGKLAFDAQPNWAPLRHAERLRNVCFHHTF